MGESLGGSPAIHIASKYAVSGLIILSTYTSLHSIIQGNYLLYAIARAVTTDINYHTDNIRMISKVSCPVLIYHSIDDKLINYSNAMDLLAAINHRKKRLVTIHGDHDKPQFQIEDLEEMVRFLKLDNIQHSDIINMLQIIDNISNLSHEELTNS